MTDRFSKAVEELDKKSAFVCESCGHPHDIASVRRKGAEESGTELKDRFSKPVEESAEKSAFVCVSCGRSQKIPKARK
jgi:rubrerythrin